MSRARLSPCAACARHVRDAETVCPFCGAAFTASPAPTRVLSARLGRGALLVFGLATVTGVALDLEGCAMGAYGGPRPDIGPRPDAGVDAPSVDAPSVDASDRDAGRAPDGGPDAP